MSRKITDRSDLGVIISTVVLFVVFLFWADQTHLDLVTHGQGRVVALGQNKEVQVADAGTVQRVLVAVGDRVRAGQVIAEINPTEARGTLTEIENRLVNLDVRLARIAAELAGADVIDFSQIEGNPQEDVIAVERGLMAARAADLAAQRFSLQQNRLRTERELSGLSAELAGVEARAALLDKERGEIMPMVELGVLGASERFRLEAETNGLATETSVLRERQAALEFALTGIDAEQEALGRRHESELQAQRAALLAERVELQARLPVLRQRLELTELRAPVDGVVNQLFSNTIGAVLRAGDVLAEIVPTGEDLQVAADIAPSDIASVEPGQKVRISLTAYDATRYGYLSGEVLRVSADATFRDELKTRMYVADISISGQLLEDDGTPVTILPGMIAAADIVRGKRSILDYFWQPISKAKDSAFRD